MGPNDAVRLFDCKGASCSTSPRSRARMYEAERKGEGLFFMRTQAAIKAATVSPEQVFGEWTLAAGNSRSRCASSRCRTPPPASDSYKIVGEARLRCRRSPGFGLSTWRLDANELLLERPRRHLAVLRERRHDLGAHSRQHRSAAADAAVASHPFSGPVELKKIRRLKPAHPGHDGVDHGCGCSGSKAWLALRITATLTRSPSSSLSSFMRSIG